MVENNIFSWLHLCDFLARTTKTGLQKSGHQPDGITKNNVHCCLALLLVLYNYCYEFYPTALVITTTPLVRSFTGHLQILCTPLTI